MNAEKPRINLYVKTLGCKVNQVESENLLRELAHYDVALVDDMAQANVIIINTCSVTSEADAKTRKAIRKCARQRGVLLAIPTGCSAALHEDELNALEDNVEVVADKTALARFLIDRFALEPLGHEVSLEEIREEHPTLFRSRSFVKVQDGCDNFCSYCIVPYARNVLRSTPALEVVAEVEKLAANGVKEIVLTGINVGRYNDAAAGVANLPALIKRLAATDIKRIRVSSIEPIHVDDELVQLLATEPKLCEHLHIPLQSGSDAVLEAMNRHYSSEQFIAMVDRLKQVAPHIAVTTDVIVGFPGETEADFNKTLEVCERCGFAKIHVFRYSKRAGTPAAQREQVDARTSARRAQLIRVLGARLAEDYRKNAQGRTLEVLVESARDGRLNATSREHIVMSFDEGATDLHGASMKVGNIYSVIG